MSRTKQTRGPVAPLFTLEGGRLPIIALIGRPNVGKSTLFNRILGTRAAIVDDVPGVTRDRNYADSTYRNRRFRLETPGAMSQAEVDALIERKRRADPDLWLVEIEDRSGYGGLVPEGDDSL